MVKGLAKLMNRMRHSLLAKCVDTCLFNNEERLLPNDCTNDISHRRTDALFLKEWVHWISTNTTMNPNIGWSSALGWLLHFGLMAQPVSHSTAGPDDAQQVVTDCRALVSIGQDSRDQACDW